MALEILSNSLNKFINIINLNGCRNLKFTPYFLKSDFSTFTPNYSKKDIPVKYTTNKAASLKVSETLGIKNAVDDERPKYQSVVIGFSLAVFLAYFCILREESDIDEIMKGNPDYTNDTNKLLELQFKLRYCEQNNMPTKAIIEKIEELKAKINRN